MVTARGSYIATASVSPSGQWIMQMVAFRAASGSTTPPTAPGNVTATATSVSQINLGWTASTSTVGLSELYRATLPRGGLHQLCADRLANRNYATATRA